MRGTTGHGPLSGTDDRRPTTDTDEGETTHEADEQPGRSRHRRLDPNAGGVHRPPSGRRGLGGDGARVGGPERRVGLHPAELRDRDPRRTTTREPATRQIPRSSTRAGPTTPSRRATCSATTLRPSSRAQPIRATGPTRELLRLDGPAEPFDVGAANTQTSPGVFNYDGHWVMFYDAAQSGHASDSGFDCLAVATAASISPPTCSSATRPAGPSSARRRARSTLSPSSTRARVWPTSSGSRTTAVRRARPTSGPSS